MMQAAWAEVGLVYYWLIGIDENEFVPAAKSNNTAQERVTAELAEANFLADLREDKHRKMVIINIHFARRALDDNQLGMALYYCGPAFRARRGASLEQSNFEFRTSFLVRMARLAGVIRPRFTKLSSIVLQRVSFKELCALAPWECRPSKRLTSVFGARCDKPVMPIFRGW
jgi:hypothetical protein